MSTRWSRRRASGRPGTSAYRDGSARCRRRRSAGPAASPTAARAAAGGWLMTGNPSRRRRSARSDRSGQRSAPTKRALPSSASKNTPSSAMPAPSASRRAWARSRGCAVADDRPADDVEANACLARRRSAPASATRAAARAGPARPGCRGRAPARTHCSLRHTGPDREGTKGRFITGHASADSQAPRKALISLAT